MAGYDLILHPARRRYLPLEGLAAAAGLHPGLVDRFVAYGLLEPAGPEEGTWFDAGAVRRLGTICRLRDDLGINLPGVVVVLDLLERIESLRRELADSRRR